jgi:hypothetical protein
MHCGYAKHFTARQLFQLTPLAWGKQIGQRKHKPMRLLCRKKSNRFAELIIPDGGR